MTKFYYVYLLIDVATETHRYTGVIADLKARLAKHNAGEVPHTSKFRQWKVESYFAFETKEKAVAFESYLKTGTGHDFANRHFLIFFDLACAKSFFVDSDRSVRNCLINKK